MGSKITIVMDGGAPVPAEARRWFLAWEACMSRFDAASELCQLNRQPETWVKVSQPLWAVLRSALKAHRATGGLVTPSVLPALEAAGYTQTFEDLPAPATPPAALLSDSSKSAGGIEFNLATRSVWLPRDVRLDLGGFAKGWAADQAAHRLGIIAPTLVDAGGDIAVSGPRADGSAWLVRVADPLRAGEALLDWPLRRGGLATSGSQYRRWEQDGRTQHHLIDPRIARPAQTDLSAVTVWASSALQAEIAAKAVFILGSEHGLCWLKTRRGLRGVLCMSDGQVIYR
jgi:thiamine biosynthesis lipoprotein